MSAVALQLACSCSFGIVSTESCSCKITDEFCATVAVEVVSRAMWSSIDGAREAPRVRNPFTQGMRMLVEVRLSCIACSINTSVCCFRNLRIYGLVYLAKRMDEVNGVDGVRHECDCSVSVQFFYSHVVNP